MALIQPDGFCFRVLAEHSSNLVLLINTEFIICELNSIAKELLLTPKKLTEGEKFTDYFISNPSFFPTIKEPCKNFASRIYIDNSVLLIDWQATAIIHYNQITGYLLIGRADCFLANKKFKQSIITNEEAIKEDYISVLKDKIHFYQSLIDSLPGAIYWKNINGTYIGCNYNNARNAGYKFASEILGKTDYDLAWKEQADEICAIDKKVISTGKPHIAKEYGKLATGKIIPALSHKIPIRNSEGKIIGILGVSMDITKFDKAIANLEQQTKQANATALKSQIYLENLIAAMPGHVYWKDKNGVYLGSNDRNAQIAGLSTGKELVGKTDYDLPWKNQADKLREADNKVMQAGKAIITEESGYIANDVYITVLSHKVPLYDQKKHIIGTVGISLDISELKRTQIALKEAKEKAEAANQAKSDFIANMSHDIRTPFNGILSLMQFLAAREEDKEKKECMQLIVDTANGLHNFLNEVLEMTEIESGQHAISTIKFSLPDLIQDIVLIMQSSLKQKKLEMLYEYPTAVPKYFIGDRLRIHRIILNIASNSLKFTEKGFIRITTDIHEKNENSVIIRLAITDTGIGIPQDKFEMIFEKFTRLNLSHRGIYQGTGLGLGIVKQYLNDINGKIELHSKIGEGSTFTCYLPLTIATDNTE